MRAKIFSREEHITRLLGSAYDRELTFPHIFKDSKRSIHPVLIEVNGRKHVVVGDFDSAAHQAAKQNIPFSTFGRYFSWNHPAGAVPPSFAEAVWAAAGSDGLEVEADMPVGRVDQLAAKGDVAVFGEVADPPVHLYAKSRAELEAVWASTRDADVPRLTPFVSGLRFGETLVAAMSAAPLGFEVLDALAEKAGLDAILVTAAFDAEMFTGLTRQTLGDHGATALYVRGAADILVLSPLPIERADFRPLGTAACAADAVAAHAKGAIGFQRGNMSIGAYRRFEAAGVRFTDATMTLRRFFDERAGTDLLYFITAANAVLAGIEHANAYIRRTVAGGTLTERDVAAVYHQGVDDFAAGIGMQDRIHSYFDIIHPGERTLLPAMAGDYPVLPGHKTIKYDMGLLVTDSTGVVRGCSDIARTLSFDVDLQAAHDRLRALLVDELIPSLMPGMTGEEAHARGVAVLRPVVDEMKRIGMLHPEMTIEGYTRDCGHTLQRQTLATVHFMPGDTGTFHAGMLGCTEFVWPIDDKIIACEDGYYVTPEGAIPFTI
ncbi:Xaa-Pro aminopeptidase [Acuticoccus sediminis]|uniref:Xaa-Pro aminopeptidase n=1 Tax=Acuticoccus sediminis TaxID=2184697 RepID=A0A8B2NMA7_9HYPH|nr:Xaa-Pro aminopeptidase [Acuticoccus sediminis]